MQRVKTFEATGVAPEGKLYAGDLNAIQDATAALYDLAQNLGIAQVAIGESGLLLNRFGTGEARLTGALRTDGIMRGLGGLYAGAFTTAQRDAIATGLAPKGLVILNTTTDRYEWNQGSDAARNWLPVGPTGPWGTADLVNGAVTNAKLATDSVTSAKILNGEIDTAKLVDDAVSNAKLRNSAALSVIGRSANSTGDPADVAGTLGQVLRVGAGPALGFGQVDLAAAAAVTGILPAANIDAAIARLASPVFTGVPAAPTAAVDVSTTQLATTAFVTNQAGASAPLMDGTATVGISKRYTRDDHRHPTDTTRAPLAAPTFTGIVDVSQSFRLSGDISPAQITANQNNYSPTGLATASVLRLTTDASRTITGLADGADGRIIVIYNIGSNPVVFAHDNAGSTAANRFLLPSNLNLALQPNQSVALGYDSTSARWRLVSESGSQSQEDYGTAFPTTGLYNGRRFTLFVSGLAWDFVYRADLDATYPWHFRGGAPLFSEVTASSSLTSTSYVALSGPSIALPVAGDYDVEQGFVATVISGAPVVRMSYDIGATAAVDADAARALVAEFNNPALDAGMRARRKTGLGAVTLTSMCRVDTGSVNISDRWMRVMPVKLA